MLSSPSQPRRVVLIAGALLLTCLVYWPGLSGSWFFDDYPNIVDNPDVQPEHLGLSELTAAALSSPASDIGRPLASLSFVANHALGGMDPFGWKLTNLLIHLLNGWLMFLLARALQRAGPRLEIPPPHADATAALIAASWLLLPINLAPVLLIVQRMESMANLFVLLGLLGYLRGRQRMLQGRSGLALCSASLVVATSLGVLAKETAVLLPLYAFVIECLLFGFRREDGKKPEGRLFALFTCVLAFPILIGLAWLLPRLMRPAAWATRDFTMATRLLSEARIVVDYIGWTLLPLPQTLAFYHDDFTVSQGFLSPWTTSACILVLACLLAVIVWLRRSRPLVALGLSWFLAAHLLTGTVLPLELVYEHRNYFASFGLLLAAMPWLASATATLAVPRRALLALLLLWWTGLTAWTAHAWGAPLRLASELAVRAPDSPRAQFAFGKELLTRSGYDPASPLFVQAQGILERTSGLPASSILPEQTLILTANLMQRPMEPHWWDRLIAKLAEKTPNSEDVDALGALTRCAVKRDCDLPRDRMNDAFAAAESHARINAKLLTIHGDWAWNVLGDRVLGERYADASIRARPRDADARITLARMNVVLGNLNKAREQMLALESLNSMGRFDKAVDELRILVEARSSAD